MSHIEAMSQSDQQPQEHLEDNIFIPPSNKEEEEALAPLESVDLAEMESDVAGAEVQEEVADESPSEREGELEGAIVAEPQAAHEPESVHSKEKGQKQHFDAFLEELKIQPDADSKLLLAISFMESSLAQHGNPHFKSFWEARNLCLDLFKENINPAVRSDMWNKYTELSKEARRLKEILDEQSAFAAEQIEIAIQALEQEIKKNSERVESLEANSILPSCVTLQKKNEFYELRQYELNLLNAQASRINALRKELIRTEMRVRQKNKFFQQLSVAGDLVFPRRKELIKEISQHFMDDVDAFVSEYFEETDFGDSLFLLREEIKTLQGIAKLLTLNTHSFTHTRMRLSECWDKIKIAEKERKKERAQQKGIYKQNAQNIQSKIQEFQVSFAEGQLSTSDANEKIDEIFFLMKRTDLGREEIKLLREDLAQARKPLLDKAKLEEENRYAAEQERERLKKEKVISLRQDIDNLLQSAAQKEAEELVSARDALMLEISQIPSTKQEKQELERLLKPLKDVITDKKEKALMNLSDDDRQALVQLNDLLKQRKDRRQEIKKQIEIYRKASGSSGLDFEKAMAFNAQMAEEKNRLEKLNDGIRDIEEKVSNLQKQL